jgi:hypothetical protein
MSLLIVLAVVFALAALAVIVFVAVVLAIHSEPNNQMTTRAQSPLAAVVRRLLGVYVGKPAKTDANDNREECLAGSSTDWWNKGGRGR